MTGIPRRTGIALAGAGAALVGALGLVGCSAAVATVWDPVPETGAPGGLVLDAASYPMQIPRLAPGDPAYWQIHTRIDQDGTIRLNLELRKDGNLVTHPNGLWVTVTSCDEEWQHLDAAPACAAPAEVVSAGPADQHTFSSSTSSSSYRVQDRDDDGETFLLVELAVEDSPAAAADESLMGLRATVGVGVTAADAPTEPIANDPTSDGADRAPISALAYTGGSFLGPILLAAALVLIGVAIRLHRTAARERTGLQP